MKITDTKLVYNEFKFFKSIYTKINIAESIYFISKDNEVNLIFNTDSVYFYLRGKLSGETEFIKWLNEHKKPVELKLEDINKIAKCLKKNAISIYSDDENFVFNFNDKEENAQTIRIKIFDLADSEIIQKKLDSMEREYGHEFSITSDYLTQDIFEVYFNEETISKERTKDRVLEIPKVN